MSRAQQPSILSFFQPNKQQPPKYAAPPTSQAQQQQAPRQKVPSPAPPPPPPPPQPVAPVAPVISASPVTALPPSTPSPHPSATIVPVTDAHIPALRRINALLLPVNYTDSFYKAILDPAQSGLFSRAILFRDGADGPGPAAPAPKVVGGLVCRLEPSPFDPATGAFSPDLARLAHARVSPPDARVLYVQSLGVLAPYRGLGLAAAAVEGISDAVRAVAADARGNGLNIGWIYAHVWTENHDALEWYARRGFERDARLENYYFKLQPGSAWVMKRRVLPSGVGDETGSCQRTWAATNGHAAHQPSAVPASVTAAAVNLPGFSPADGLPTPPPSAANGPPPAARPGPPGSSLSFQNKRPDMEWNDLPEDMVAAARTTSRTKDLLSPPTGSGSSSRSSSTAGRKKKDRAYPTAAFGS